MSRQTTSLRATAVSIVYGWLCLLAFALAATTLSAKARPDAPPAHHATVAPSQFGAKGPVVFRAAQRDRDQTPGLISSR